MTVPFSPSTGGATFLSFLALLGCVDAGGSITEELPPVVQRLVYEGNISPSVINRYDIHIDLNRANYDADGGPPSLALRASALLCSEFLALVHPPVDRTLDHKLGTIAPKCEDVDGGGIACRLDDYVVFESRLQFSYALSYAEFSLPGMDDAENSAKKKKDEDGFPLPSKGGTVEVRFEVLDRRERGREALEGIVGISNDMFGVKDPKTTIDDVERGVNAGQGAGGRTASSPESRQGEHGTGTDEL